MKRTLVIIVLAFGIFTLTSTDASAEVRMHSDVAGCHGADYYECCHDGAGYRQADCPGAKTYSRSALETINGEVIEVYQATSRRGYQSGLHLLLKANAETIDVHLGPIAYIEDQNFNFEPGDALEIQGDRLTKSQMPTMTAIEVTKGNETLTLRDEDGFPMWRTSLRQ